MKHIIVTLTLIAGLIILSGCSTMSGYFGKSSNTVAKQQIKITQIDDRLNDLQASKINNISQLSFGVNEALNKVTNAPIEVKVASELNSRVESIAGLPSIEQQKEMIKLVSDLLKQNIEGVQELKAKDKELTSLQYEEKSLLKEKEIQIDKQTELVKSIALQSDSKTLELDKYNSYWGLGAVAIGIKSFLTHSFWTLLIFGTIGIIAFTLLRVLSYSNPLAAVAFGLMQDVGATLIHLIETIIPDSISTLETAKNDVSRVTTSIANGINTPSSVK